MKCFKCFNGNRGMLYLMVFLLLIPGICLGQASAPATADSSLIPWLGVWRAVDEPIPSDSKAPAEPGVLEIRPAGSGKGLEITRKGAEKSVSETLIPDGIQRTNASQNCTNAQSYSWEAQTGLLMGSTEIKCKDASTYQISNIKMLVSPSRMTDILVIKTSGQTRIAVRHFAFARSLSSTEEEAFPDQVTLAMRSALAAPWDLNKIVHLSKLVDVSTLQAVLLEKEVQIRVDAKSLKQMKSANVHKDVVDLLVAMALPEKFQIKKNGKIAVASYAPAARESSTTYVYSGDPFYDYYGYHNPYWRYGWGSYWSYNSPFWWDYPIYVYPIPNGNGGNGGNGGGGGGGGSVPVYSNGRLSSQSGYVQITPRDTGHTAVPRSGYVTSGSYSGSTTGRSATYAPSGGGAAVSAPSGGGSYSSGGGSYSGGSSSGGGSYSAPSASPSGYSGGGGGGQAVPRN